MTVIVLSVCVVVLICIILSQLRNSFIRRKLNRQLLNLNSPLFMYPPIPFTMDRLLEQRRVMGPSTSVDTNLYIESWQQADSQAPTQWTLSVSPVSATNTFPPSESVSACPSPVPLRTYRLGPASASTSPIVAVRGLGSRMALRGLLPMPIDSPSNGSREVVLNSCT
ncbi:uncharacterized protein LOC135216498 [Macrobrachium nipponense]|uniref:uncharacterized protein LOC135216498 n=1 Tax=Macrobrachium nipponense TaxID=159736 RepID=UPI0030C812F9